MTDPLLPALPDTVRETTVTVGDVDLRVLRAGSGRPLLLLPGWTCSADFFVHQLTGLADGFDVVAIDPRGHGGSSKPLTGNTFAQRGDDLARLIDALGLDDVTLLGWSFGVFDVLSHLRHHGTGKVSRVVLVDETPKVPADPANPTEWGEAPLSDDGIVAFFRAMIDTRVDFWTSYAVYMLGLPEETGAEHPDVARIVELGMQTPEHVAITTAADGLTSDYSADAARISTEVPTLFVARDDWADDARRWVSANMPDAEFATMPFHMGFVTHPAQFNELIAEFARG
ncbi:MAG TPA: alpha/beta hydrolase [Microbacterium sp.]|nr:alpha/beta hydrolase [Microbacterium sp.]